MTRPTIGLLVAPLAAPAPDGVAALDPQRWYDQHRSGMRVEV
jgi:hypothetical protein